MTTPEEKTIKLVLKTFLVYGLRCAIANWITILFKKESVDDRFDIANTKIKAFAKKLKSDIGDFYICRLEEHLSDVLDEQISTRRAVLKITHRIDAMTNTMKNSAIEDPMRQALPAPVSDLDESFEHLSELDQNAGPSNESSYAHNATPTDFAADYPIALSHLKAQEIERRGAVQQARQIKPIFLFV